VALVMAGGRAPATQQYRRRAARHTTRTVRALLLGLAMWCEPAAAQSTGSTAQPAAPAQQGDATAPAPVPVRDRERLTGDWGGARDAAANRGFTFQVELTGFFQGALSGAPTRAEPSSRVDALISVDASKLGLWRGLGFNTHIESAFGDIPVFRGGALWPTHTGTALPLSARDRVEATSLYVTQRIGRAATLMVGKINGVDLLARDPFFGGWGAHRFEHLVFVAPPSGLVPPVIMGAVLTAARAPFSYTVMVYDPDDRTTDYGVSSLFENGVNAQVGVTWNGVVGGRATNVGVSATGSTTDKIDFGDILLPPELQGPTRDGSWNLAVQAGHLIVPSAVQKGRGLGVYAKAAIADGNPNIIRRSVAGGMAAHGVIAARPWDSFGAGYFYYGFSDALQSSVAPLVAFGDEQGLEVFYNAAATRWLRFGANLQVVAPAGTDRDTLVVGGVRANIVF
jgi:porin